MEDYTIYKVVVNAEQQYSIWPADRENALGWSDAGKSGTKEECLAYIKEVWTDLRPLSLRREMDERETASDEPEKRADNSFAEFSELRGTMTTPYVGEIRMFAGNFPPDGWLFCDGQLLPIDENETLFTLIGTTYGGDGQTTFMLPDLRGRSPMHQGRCPGTSGLDYRVGEMGALGFRDAEAAESLSHADEDVSRAVRYLPLSFIISLFGVFPSEGGGLVSDAAYLSEGRIFAFNFAPGGWAPCNGQLMPINQNQALFALLGTTYGGNGQTTFALPDLRGSIPMHFGYHERSYELGQRVGEEDNLASEPAYSNEVSVEFLVLNFCIALQGIFPSRN